MILGKVIGTVWATRRAEGLEGTKMQLVQPITGEGKPVGRPIAAFDSVGAGQGETVYYVLQYEATLAFPDRKLVPVDASIVGIVDRLDVEWDRGSGPSRVEYDYALHGPLIGASVRF